MDRDWTASFSIRFRNGTCIIILDKKKYNIANSSCCFGSYGSIWTVYLATFIVSMTTFCFSMFVCELILSASICLPSYIKTNADDIRPNTPRCFYFLLLPRDCYILIYYRLSFKKKYNNRIKSGNSSNWKIKTLFFIILSIDNIKSK
jgi:hypothetical protein